MGSQKAGRSHHFLPALFHVADNCLGTPDQFRSDLYSPARVNRLGLVTERLHLLV